MEKEKGQLQQGPGYNAVGILLILFGVLFFAGQLFNFDFTQYGWPLVIIVPGVLVLLAGLLAEQQGEGVLVTLGSVATAVGLILFFQNSSGLWATWAYVWALIPAAVGLGQILHGLMHRHADNVEGGLRMLLIGLALFAGGAFFFEGIMDLNGFGFVPAWSTSLWPLLLIGAGILLLVQNFVRNRNA